MAADTQILVPRLRYILLAFLVVGAVVGIGVVGAECRDTLALQGTPAVNFNITSTASEFTVTHAGGQSITDDQYTVAVTILVAHSIEETTPRYRYTWANQTNGGFPISTGDSVTLRNLTLEDGMVIRVVHRGYEVPQYCPARGTPQRIVLGQATH